MSKEGHATKQNTIIIVCDSLRVDFAYSAKTMPFLSSFGSKNYTSLKSYTNAPSTYFAIPTLLTGYMPFEVTNKSGVNKKNLGSFLPKLFKAKGYNTICITGSIVTSRAYGYKRYWDYFDDFWDTTQVTRKTEILEIFRKLSRFIPKSLKDTIFKPIKGKLNLFLDEKIKIEKKIRAENILLSLERSPIENDLGNFIFLHFMDPHVPYAPVSREKDFPKIQYLTNKVIGNKYDKSAFSQGELAFLLTTYKEECNYLDKQLSETIAYLKSKLDWDNTKLIITADHGEAFGETGYFLHPDSKTSNKHHINTPLIAKGFPFSTEKNFWTVDLYNFLCPNRMKKKVYEFVVAYKPSYKSRSLGPKKDYFPSKIDFLDRSENISSASDLPYLVKKELSLTDRISV